MTAEEIRRCGTGFPDAPLYYHELVEGSTNRVAKELALSGAPHGTAVIADSQTGGRGRFGRPFFSPPGRGIYLSLVARPVWPRERLPLLTVYTAAAVCDAIEASCARRPEVKWVNDLFMDGRKVCGILAELSFEQGSGRVAWAVIGVGINVNGCEFPPELQGTAGSLEMAAGGPVKRARLAAGVLKALADMLDAAPEAYAHYLRQYRAGCLTLGRTVSVTRNGECKRGQAMSVEDDGALLVRFEDGRTEAVRSGEATLHSEFPSCKMK